MKTPEELREIGQFYLALSENQNGFSYGGVQDKEDFESFGKFEGPNLRASNIEWYKVNPPKPVPKIINLGLMVGSDIDMEFANAADNDWYIYKLTKIDNEGYYSEKNNKYGHRCRIRENHWHFWNGGKCPLPEGLIIDIRYKGGIELGVTNYTTWSWVFTEHNLSITGFKITGKKDNYIYLWERKNKT